VETFTNAGKMINDSDYPRKRAEQISKIRHLKLDPQLYKLICEFNTIPYAFTLQCCWGHFLPQGQKNPVKMNELPESMEIETFVYRIAYIAFCIQHCREGRRLLKDLEQMVRLNPRFIQFGSAAWFWRRQMNSFVLQVMPDRFKLCDWIELDYEEALKTQKWRNALFSQLSKRIGRESSADERTDTTISPNKIRKPTQEN